GHTHLYLYSFDKQSPLNSEATLERQLTQGEFEVMGVKGIDADAGLVYFASNQSDPRQEQIFSGKLDGSGFQRISKEAGTHTASFCLNGKYFVDGYLALVYALRGLVCSEGGWRYVYYVGVVGV